MAPMLTVLYLTELPPRTSCHFSICVKFGLFFNFKICVIFGCGNENGNYETISKLLYFPFVNFDLVCWFLQIQIQLLFNHGAWFLCCLEEYCSIFLNLKVCWFLQIQIQLLFNHGAWFLCCLEEYCSIFLNLNFLPDIFFGCGKGAIGH